MGYSIGPNGQGCGNCRFFRAFDDGKDTDGEADGMCLRHAPLPIAGDPQAPPDEMNAWWPVISESLWCGEWRRNWKVPMKGGK
jgi:hypothetical protein